MNLRQIVEDYEAGRIDAAEALELSDCVSLVVMYQLLEAAEAGAAATAFARSA